MKRVRLFLLLLPVISLIASCKDELVVRKVESSLNLDIEFSEEDYKPRSTVNGTNNYVRIIVGDYESPIILASPHDGVLTANIPERTHSSATIVRDTWVTDLALRTADSLQKLTGYRPHVIINLLHRNRMEPNRELADAYHKHPDADKAWMEYHDFLKIARKIVKKHVGKGLYIDLHGHGHTKSSTEVGYLLTRNDLNNTDESINFMAYKSSIFSLGKRSPLPFSQLINGDAAFGTFLANYGCASFPSKQDPRPNGNPYFNGGYCTSTYGSRINDDGIDAIQLETPGNIRYREENGDQWRSILYGGRMARAIIDFIELNYDLDLKKNP